MSRSISGNWKPTFLYIGLVLFLTPFLLSQNTKADSVNFSIRTILPENQTNRDRTFFDLKTYPAMEQTIEVLVTNYTEDVITIYVQVATATTGPGGVANYSYVPQEPDDTLLFLMEELIEFPELVEIPGGESKLVPFHISMPHEGYEGVLAGGISFSQVLDDEIKTGETIRNTFSYLSAILLRQGDQEMGPNPILRWVAAKEVEEQLKLSANIQNTHPAFFHQMSIEAGIYARASAKEVYRPENHLIKETRTSLSMAPNSNFDFSWMIPIEDLPEVFTRETLFGIELILSDIHNNHWVLRDEFTIQLEGFLPYDLTEVEELTPSDFSLEKRMMIIGAIFIFLLIAVFSILSFHINEKQKESVLHYKKQMMLKLIKDD